MSLEDLVKGLASALLGAGFVSWLFRRWLDKKLSTAERKKRERLEAEREAYILQEEYRQATGRVIFWLCRGAARMESETGERYWNGELERARANFEAVEKRMKEYQNEQLAKHSKEE